MPNLNSPTLSGDISGTIYSISVNKIKGVSIASTAPLANQVLAYDGAQWSPSSALSGTRATFSISVSAPALSGIHFGDGSRLTGVSSSDKLPLSGGVLVGGLTGTTATFSTSVSAPALSGIHFGDGSRLTGVSSSDKLPLSGGVLAGGLTGTIATFTASVSAPALSGAHFGDGSRLTGISTTDATKLPLSGGTLTGILSANGASFSYMAAPFINSSSDPYANEVTVNVMTNYIDGNNSVFLNLATTPSNALLSQGGPSIYTSGVTRPGGGATTLRIYGASDIGSRSMLYDNDTVALSAFNFGNNNYTIEAWIYPMQSGRTVWIADSRIQGTTDDGKDYVVLQVSTTGRPLLSQRVGNTTFSDLTVSLSAWSHICFQRTGNIVNCFVNGVPSVTTATAGSQITNNGFTIGNAANFFFGDSASGGYALDFFRVTRNVARYPVTGFTPPATNIQEPSSQTPIRFSAPIAAPSLSGAFFGDGSRLTGITGGTANALPLSGGDVTGNLNVNGNFGVGTTSPTTKMHVVGNSRLQGDLTITGNLSCTGTQTFTNTVFTTTSAVSVVNFGTGAALYVGNNGTGDIASFYDIDTNTEVLHVGGNNGTFPNVGVKTSNPNKTLTVAGEISASQDIWTTTNFNGARATLTSSVSAPALSGAHFGDGSRLTGIIDTTRLPLSGGTMTGQLNLVTTTETKATPSIASNALSLDLATATFFSVTVNSNVTFTFANTPASPRVYSFMLQLIGDGTARTITWPGTVRWGGGVAPVVTSTLNKVDTFSFLTHDGGTNWFGFIVDQNS